MTDTRVIFGLGNPGAQYRNTRHNCGFRFVEQIASQHQSQLKANPRLQSDLVRVTINGAAVWLVQPMTYMNRSGSAFHLVTRYYDIDPDNAVVVYDDLDLPVGSAHSTTRNFLRIRLGIGRPHRNANTIPYVLSVPPATDQILINQAIEDTIDALPEMLTGNLEKAMTLLHSRGSQKGSEEQSAT